MHLDDLLSSSLLVTFRTFQYRVDLLDSLLKDGICAGPRLFGPLSSSCIAYFGGVPFKFQVPKSRKNPRKIQSDGSEIPAQVIPDSLQKDLYVEKDGTLVDTINCLSMLLLSYVRRYLPICLPLRSTVPSQDVLHVISRI